MGEVIASNPITFIAPRADDATQSVLAKATLRQSPPSIRVMQYVRCRIIWNNDPALVVPLVAVTRIGGQYFVLVAEESEKGAVARQRPVTLGEVIGEDYLVRSGLKPGEKVIVSNLQKIRDGAPIKPS
jgi:multidrug efflux pump subunit AcrA (membrane-fusion protein)